MVGNEHLVAEKLYFVALKFYIVLHTWEVEDTCEVERVVHIKVNPEQRFVVHWEKCAVEALVIFVGQSRWCLCPQWFHTVYNIVFIGFNVLSVLPFGAFAEYNGHSHKLAVLVEQALNLLFLQKLLAIVVDVEHNVCTTTRLLCIFERELWASVAAPLHCLRIVAIAFRNDFHLFRHHKG